MGNAFDELERAKYSASDVVREKMRAVDAALKARDNARELASNASAHEIISDYDFHDYSLDKIIKHKHICHKKWKNGNKQTQVY